MTKEEAKKILEEAKTIDDSIYQYNTKYLEAVDMAIKALEQEHCEDAISRQAVLDELDKHKYSNGFCEEHNIDWSINLGMAHIVIKELPSATLQEQKIGHWMHRNDDFNDWFECSECEYGSEGEITIESGVRFRYCPNCGAKMEGVQE